MAISIHTPSAPLNTYIEAMWYSEGPSPFRRLRVMPMPSLHLQVNFGDVFQIYKPDHRSPFMTCAESWSVGLCNEYHIMDWPQQIKVLNVSFRPGGAYPFMRLPLSELHNQVVSLDEIWGNFAAEIRERLYAAPTIQARFMLLEQLLMARLCEIPYGLNIVQTAVAEIARHRGVLSIQALSDHLGISQKHLITQFKQMVGSTPKELARIYRFRRVLYGIDPTQPVDWRDLARQSLYYDQPHFNRDFEAFTGHTPTDYLLLRGQIHVENPKHAQYPQLLPTG
ncbi:MAG: helix-turn-helix domain-containing protein [Chloroflexota bacterium]